MELFIIILLALVFIETTALIIKNFHQLLPAKASKRKLYIDTSALIDGRILAVAQTGFLSDDLIIPRSVIRELQLLADGHDNEKRLRARFGMDVASELERVVYCNTFILQDDLDHTPVDERLIKLAKKNHGAIVTTDFNLGKVAATEHIDVLNINDLALVLRTEYLPGEHIKLKITTAGTNPNQGVGYLPDGTMVVVDNASSKIGQEVEIEFIRFVQTSSGRMMFAKLYAASRSSKSSAKTPKLSTVSSPRSKPRIPKHHSR